MARDPSTRICSMVQTLDDGDGVTVSVATHDERQAFAIVLDGDESAAFQRTLAFDRDAVVLGLRETIAGTRARAERAESALAAECTKSAAGLKAIEAAQAGIERLTRERTTAEALAARRDDALATEKLNHDQTKQKAIDLGNSNHNLRNLCEQLEKRAEAAESNCGEWKGRAITAKTDRDEALAAYETAKRARDAAEESEAATAKANADLVAAAEATRERLLTLGRITEDERDHFADMLSVALGKPWTKLPDAPKRYPAWETSGGPNECSHGYAEGIPCERCDKAKANPAGEPPVALWGIKTPSGVVHDGWSSRSTAETWQRSIGGTIVPLYEAPPPAAGVDVGHIRTLIEHGKQGCFDLSSFLIVLGNMLGELPTVDIERLRTIARGLVAGREVSELRAEILAAIGEKA